jgi:ABC-type antimicrobial peptide transport system permease subunit
VARGPHPPPGFESLRRWARAGSPLWTFQFFYPYDVAALSIVAAILLCILAGFGPAKQAASLPIVSAIGYE